MANEERRPRRRRLLVALGILGAAGAGLGEYSLANGLDQLKANGLAEAVLYDPSGVGGTGVVTVLAHGNRPEWYGLPADPHVPLAVRVWKSVLRPLGIFAIFGSVIGAFAHFMTEGPKEVKEAEGEGPPRPEV